MDKTTFDNWVQSKFNGRFIKMTAPRVVGTAKNDEYTLYKCICVAHSEDFADCMDDRYGLAFYLQKEPIEDYRPCTNRGAGTHPIFMQESAIGNTFIEEIKTYVASKNLICGAIGIIRDGELARVTAYDVQNGNAQELNALVYYSADASLNHKLIVNA